MTITRSHVTAAGAAIACSALIYLGIPTMNIVEDRKLLLLIALAFIATIVLLAPWPKIKDLHKETDHVGMVMFICFMIFIAICSMAVWSLLDRAVLQAMQAS